MDCPLAESAPPSATTDPGLASWLDRFQAEPIPVLAATAEAVAALHRKEDEVDANLIGEVVADDPLMSLRVLAHAAANRSSRVLGDTGTVTAAVVMMGIGPFFRAFGELPTVEQRLAEAPQALCGVRELLKRSNRAATFALAFAVHRADPDAALIHQAALLHDFAELLLWSHAPEKALELRHLQRSHPDLRSTAAQRRVLGIELPDLQLALARAWRLHPLLVKSADEAFAGPPALKAVTLAARLARHSAGGWDNPALADDFADAALLLNLSPAVAQQFVLDLGD